MVIPDDDTELAQFSEDVIEPYKNNCEEWGVPLTFADEAEVALVDFAKKEANYAEVAARLTEVLLPASQEADAFVEQLLRASNKVLSVKVGERWSPVWGEAGYRNESTRIPDRMEDRLALVKKLIPFYTKRSDWQNPGLELTVPNLVNGAKRAEASHKAVKTEEQLKSKLLKESQRAAKRLRTRLRAMLNEIRDEFTSDDPRWEILGLQTPASRRASKDTRERKALVKAQARAEKGAAGARKQAESAKASAEKARVRSDAAQVSADKLKEAARKLAVKADALFAKADELDRKVREGAAALDALLLPNTDPSARTPSAPEAPATGATDSSSLPS